MTSMALEDSAPPIKLRHNTYFLPGDGIDRAVITYDICKYLDHDAKVRPGEWNEQKGYFITAYRNLTSEMVQDLKLDTARYLDEQEQKRKRNSNKRETPATGATAFVKSGDRLGCSPSPNGLSVRYENSDAHARRARIGYATDTPGPTQSQPSVYAPPPQAGGPQYVQDQYVQDAPRHQQPSPYSDMQTPYPSMQSPSSSATYPSSTSTYSSNMDASPHYATAQPNNGQHRYQQPEYDYDRRGPPPHQPPMDAGYQYSPQNAPMRSETRPQFPPQHPQQPPPNMLRQDHQRYNEYPDQGYMMDTEEDNGPGPYESERGYQQQPQQQQQPQPQQQQQPKRQPPAPVVEQRPSKSQDHRHRPDRRR